MLNAYIPILVMLVAAAVVSGGMVAASFVLGPNKPSRYKSQAYECGMTPVGTARDRFPVKFYLVAMLFIIFDIETVFLYPWAVTYRSLPHAVKLFEFAEVGLFVAILFVGYFYILGKGALDWDESEMAVPETAVRADAMDRRAPLRFGNENSGPVDLKGVPVGSRTLQYGAAAQEEYQKHSA